MLARFADQRRLYASALVALGMVFPLVLVLGVGAAVLTTLRRGLTDGMVVVAIAVAFVGIMATVMGRPIATLPIFVVMLVAGVMLAQVLGRTGSLAAAMHLGLVLGLVAVFAVMLGLQDATGWWRDQFMAMIDRAVEGGASVTVEQRAFFDAMPYNGMTGMVVSLGLLLVWGGLFIGRSWQARLVNPGGFRREFHGLRLGRVAALASAAVFFIDAFVRNDALLNAAVVLLYFWSVQGLALVHWAVGASGAGGRVLTAIYVVLALFWITGVPLAVMVPMLGLVGELVDVRGAFERALDRRRNR